jgi:hypothetical protein
MARYFVIWCLEDDVEQAIDAVEKHGRAVGPIKVHHHFTPIGISSTAEIEIEEKP